MSITKGGLVAACLLAVLVTVVAGCGGGGSSSSGSSSSSSGGSSGSSGSPLNVLAIVDTTGETKAFGEQELIGIEAAAAYYNAKGGLDGHEITVEAMSDNGDPSTAASVATKALAENPEKYAMVYPGDEGESVAALIPIMAKFPVYSVAIDDPGEACATASACPNEFTALGSGKAAVETAATWIKGEGFSKAGIFEEKTAFAETETPSMLSALEKEGVESSQASFPATSVDVSSELAQLKSDGVEVVYAEALGPAAGYVLKARAKLGWEVPVVFDLAGSALDLTTLAPPADVKEAFTTDCLCQNPKKKVLGFEELKKFAPEGSIAGIPANLAGDGWDAVTVFANAYESAESTEAKALTKATEEFSKEQENDPLYIVTASKQYTEANHQNEGEAPGDFEILPAGPVRNGQTQSPSGE